MRERYIVDVRVQVHADDHLQAEEQVLTILSDGQRKNGTGQDGYVAPGDWELNGSAQLVG
jgi:hypothetical protein